MRNLLILILLISVVTISCSSGANRIPYPGNLSTTKINATLILAPVQNAGFELEMEMHGAEPLPAGYRGKILELLNKDVFTQILLNEIKVQIPDLSNKIVINTSKDVILNTAIEGINSDPAKNPDGSFSAGYNLKQIQSKIKNPYVLIINMKFWGMQLNKWFKYTMTGELVDFSSNQILWKTQSQQIWLPKAHITEDFIDKNKVTEFMNFAAKRGIRELINDIQQGK